MEILQKDENSVNLPLLFLKVTLTIAYRYRTSTRIRIQILPLHRYHTYIIYSILKYNLFMNIYTSNNRCSLCIGCVYMYNTQGRIHQTIEMYRQYDTVAIQWRINFRHRSFYRIGKYAKQFMTKCVRLNEFRGFVSTHMAWIYICRDAVHEHPDIYFVYYFISHVHTMCVYQR